MILRVVRQVHYSPHRPNESIDVVLFINGIPFATLELKTDFTQSVEDAINQFKRDRPLLDPKTKQREPLLAFKRCIVHFAVSTDEVYMTTKLDGEKTIFLPFNVGVNNGAGNPDNPTGYKTAYLWQQILSKDNWLEIINHYVYELDNKIIFPRFHQLDVVTKLCDDIKQNNVGKRYLIQHSAGSGKTNSITWLANQLRELHDNNDDRMFECVFVITDRKVLDNQLQKNLNRFVKTAGVVKWIDDNNGSKASQLLEILQNREQSIVIVTIQSFGFLLNKIQDADFLNRNFAIIIDEAHSSTSGTAAANLKKTLSMHDEESDESSLDDLIVEEMKKHKFPKNASFFAFTATPKEKTMELFGVKNNDGIPKPFHVYSMRQAIEEGFILDVLKNYTSYRTAFKIAKIGIGNSIDAIDEQNARKTILRWVDLHPDNVGQKVAIIIEHFRKKVRNLIGGEAKAMIVTSSRLKAKRFKEALDDYIARNEYNLKTLVAFSGSLKDPEQDGDKEFNESVLNPILNGRDISTALISDKDKFTAWHCLVVANKFQTGFDEPLLCGMYVDKKLSGVATVQTLSRLNRTCVLSNNGHTYIKDNTYILDFVNDPADIKKAFSAYYTDAELEDITDPNLIDDCQIKLDEFTLPNGEKVYYQEDVENVMKANFIDNKPDQIMVSLQPSVRRFSQIQTQLKSDYKTLVDRKSFIQDEFEKSKIQQKLDEIKIKLFELKDFINQCGRYRRMYDFMSQIFDYRDTELHKRYVFYGFLIRLLKLDIPTDNQKQIIEQIKLIKVQIKDDGIANLNIDDKIKLRPIQNVVSAIVKDQTRVILDEIIAMINEKYGADVKQVDLTSFVNNVAVKMIDNEQIQEKVKNKSPFDLIMTSPVVRAIYEDSIFETESNSQTITNIAVEQEDSILGRKLKGLVLSRIYKLFEEMTHSVHN